MLQLLVKLSNTIALQLGGTLPISVFVKQRKWPHQVGAALKGANLGSLGSKQ
jgi:hypothetical protein